MSTNRCRVANEHQRSSATVTMEHTHRITFGAQQRYVANELDMSGICFRDKSVHKRDIGQSLEDIVYFDVA